MTKKNCLSRGFSRLYLPRRPGKECLFEDSVTEVGVGPLQVMDIAAIVAASAFKRA
jgi:hypothetical protein